MNSKAKTIGMVVAFCLIILGHSNAKPAEADRSVFYATLTVKDESPMPFRTPTQLTLSIYRWASVEDCSWVTEMLRTKDQETLRKLMTKKDRLGHCGALDICYAAYTKLPDGSIDVYCLTPVKIGNARVYDKNAPFSAICLRIDKDNKTTGALYTYARILAAENEACKVQTCEKPAFRVTIAEIRVFKPLGA